MHGRVIGQYRITELLGQGGMGVVYAAEHTLIGRPAAVKVLLPECSWNPEIVNRFFNEARAASAVRHPGIVEIYDFGWDSGGAAYIVMERLEGESLATRTARARMPLHRAITITRQIAGVLSAAHARGIVHRDLKPDNVFLEPDPEVAGGERVKLLDFGIAKLIGNAAGHGPGQSHAMTRTGTIVGTPGYMAPEQCRGVGVDHRADLYALGCILFELCTGRPPFIGEGAGDVTAAHIYLPVPTIASLVPDMPADVEHLMQRLLAKAPCDRLQSAAEVMLKIDEMAHCLSLAGLPSVDRAMIAPATNTTLSGAAVAARMQSAPTLDRRRGRALYWVAGTAVVVIATASTIYLAAGRATQDTGVARAPAVEPVAAVRPLPQAAQPAPVQPPPPRHPARVEVAVDSIPPSADVVLAGTVLGQTPFRGTLPYAEQDLSVLVRLRGHAELTLLVRPDKSISQQVTLAALPPNHDDGVNPFQ